jgi:hypothetical protein
MSDGMNGLVLQMNENMRGALDNNPDNVDPQVSCFFYQKSIFFIHSLRRNINTDDAND